MKKRIIFLFIIFYCFQIYGQENNSKTSLLSISYFGNYFIQPGIKVSTKIKLKSLDKLSDTKTKSRSIFISPQLGVFSRVNDNTNYLLNTEFGIRKLKSNKKIYTAYSIGFGYLIQSQLMSFSVDLSNGDHTDKLKEIRHFLMPTLNYEFGGRMKNKIGWFSKFSLGSILFGLDESTMVIFTEFGINISMNKKN